jgi:hypothetical protein
MSRIVESWNRFCRGNGSEVSMREDSLLFRTGRKGRWVRSDNDLESEDFDDDWRGEKDLKDMDIASFLAQSLRASKAR